MTFFLQAIAFVPASAYAAGSHDYWHGVNFGGWQIMEDWLFPEFLVDKQMYGGGERELILNLKLKNESLAIQVMKNHWEHFLTDDDLNQMVRLSIDTVRIPVGWWMFDTPQGGTDMHDFGFSTHDAGFVTGGINYLEAMLHKLAVRGMKVLLDLHALPGCQCALCGTWCGFRTGAANFYDNGLNYQKGLKTVTTIRDWLLELKKGKRGFDIQDVVVAFVPANEPDGYADVAANLWGNADDCKACPLQRYLLFVRNEFRVLPSIRLVLSLHMFFGGDKFPTGYIVEKREHGQLVFEGHFHKGSLHNGSILKYGWITWLQLNNWTDAIIDMHIYHAWYEYPGLYADEKKKEQSLDRACVSDFNYPIWMKHNFGIEAIVGEWSVETHGSRLGYYANFDHKFLHDLFVAQRTTHKKHMRGSFFFTWKAGVNYNPIAGAELHPNFTAANHFVDVLAAPSLHHGNLGFRLNELVARSSWQSKWDRWNLAAPVVNGPCEACASSSECRNGRFCDKDVQACSGCLYHLDFIKCEWTEKYACPGSLLPGTHGYAVNDQSIGFLCCCSQVSSAIVAASVGGTSLEFAVDKQGLQGSAFIHVLILISFIVLVACLVIKRCWRAVTLLATATALVGASAYMQNVRITTLPEISESQGK